MELIIVSKKYGTHTVYFDKKDNQLVESVTWQIHKGKCTFYARGWLRPRSKKNTVRMHRLLMGVKEGELVDHIDHNGLNNRRINLRIVTQSQNSQNMKVPRDGLTGFKGVTFVKNKKLFHARIRVNGKLISGGRTKDIIVAAKKYNELALKHFGEYAYLNIIPNE